METENEALRAVLTERFESKDLSALGYADGLRRAFLKIQKTLKEAAGE